MVSLRIAVLVGAAIAVVFVIGRWSVSRSEAPPPRSAQTPAPRAPSGFVSAGAPALAGPSAEDLRAVVRQELAAKPPAVSEPEPEDLERQAVAAQRAHAIVDAAVHAGRWTSTDARALLGVIGQLSAEDHDLVMSALIAPANAGRLRVETPGSLLDPGTEGR